MLFQYAIIFWLSSAGTACFAMATRVTKDSTSTDEPFIDGKMPRKANE